MKRLFRLSGTLLLPLIALACMAACAGPYGYGPYGPDNSMIGTITRVVGTGEVRINDRIVNEGAVMQSGDHIQTVGYAWATLALARGGEVFFDADTDPVLEWLSAALCRLRILISVGSILVDTPCETEAETGSGAVINTLGTTFHLAVTPGWTELTVIKGRMTIRSNVGGRQVVPAGFQCRVLRDRPAPRPFRVDTRPVIDWACRLDRHLCPDERPPRGDVSVPNLVGMGLDLARRTLDRYDLSMGRVREKATDRRADDGRVAAQSPKQGARVPAGARVDLVVWRYRDGIMEMPMLLNRPLRAAEMILENAGIRLGRIEEVGTRDPGQAGRVARQKPRAGTRMRPGSTAGLAVYRYERPQPPEARVPRLTGMHIDKARAELKRAGLNLGRTFTEPAASRRQVGFVLRQNPGAGSNIAPGGTVDVWVYRLEVPRIHDLHRLPQEPR